MAKDAAFAGINAILNLLDEDDLFQLASTTTQHRLKSEIIKNKTDAIAVILRYSSDYSTILNRKAVKRDVLFQYLHSNNVTLVPPITKLSLIQKILDYWNSTKTGKDVCTPQPENTDIKQTDDEIKRMAMQFSEWFYSMMNDDKHMGEEHFWQDCSLKLNLISVSATVENEVNSNSLEVVKLLYETKRTHNLFFNPNLTKDGVFGKMDVHGLVLVFVCGTLHTSENCVGVFEQNFALARDPFSDNNWKIKNTSLNLRSKDTVSETPKLCDSEYSGELVPCAEVQTV